LVFCTQAGTGEPVESRWDPGRRTLTINYLPLQLPLQGLVVGAGCLPASSLFGI